MDEENKKINLESFFKRVNSVEQIANSALSRANSNLGVISNQKSLIESLSISIEAMQTKIRDIANYIIVEKKLEADREEDRRLEAEDAEQKRQMTERATAMGQQGPQKESVKPTESKGGGGSFLGGLIKTLGGLMVGGFALKYIAPVILPKLLLLAKTKLFPLIGTGLSVAVKSSFKFLGGLVAKLFSPLTTAPIIGKIFKGIAFASPFAAVAGFLSSKILDFFSKGGKGGGDTGVSSDSNMGATNSTVETDMTDTLKKEGLVEDQKKDGGEEEINEEINEEIKEGGGEEKINDETETDASEVRSASDMMSGRGKLVNPQLEKTKTNQDGGDNDERIKLKLGKTYTKEEIIKLSKEYKSLVDKEKAASQGNGDNLTRKEMLRKRRLEVALRKLGVETRNIDLGGADVDTINKAITDFNEKEGKVPKEAPKYGDVGGLIENASKKNDLDLSLEQNLKTTDKLVNVATYESGIDNRDQNSSVLVQSKPAQTTIASIKKTSSPVAFIKSNRNQFLSINQTELPPEVARMIT